LFLGKEPSSIFPLLLEGAVLSVRTYILAVRTNIAIVAVLLHYPDDRVFTVGRNIGNRESSLASSAVLSLYFKPSLV
jgi:hypothetical protein